MHEQGNTFYFLVGEKEEQANTLKLRKLPFWSTQPRVYNHVKCKRVVELTIYLYIESIFSICI